MRLRPALLACMVAALAVVTLRLTSITIARQAAAGDDAQSQMVDVISRDATNLLVLTQDYGLRHGEQAARQWGLVHQRLSQALADYATDAADAGPQVSALQGSARALPPLFAALREAAMRDDAAAHARRETLTAQLFDETRRVSDGAFDLSRSLAERRRADARLQRWLTVATQLSLLAITLVLAGLLLRRVLRPIDRLRSVAEAVEGGDLTARSGLQRRDELGQLSQALDAMTAALQQRDAALRESNHRLAHNQAFLERAGRMTGVSGWELDLDSRQLVWTTPAHALHGRHPDPELDAEGLLRSFTPESEQRLRDAMREARRSGQGWDLELELPAAEGRPRWLHSIGAAERESGGRVVRLMGAMQDITERRAAADTLRRATLAAGAASAAKSEFLANMSHEIRTPMNAVMGLSFLLERTPLNAEQRDLLAKIGSASHSLLDVINAVLDLSKIEAGEMALEAAPFDPRALLRDVAGLFQPQAEAKGIALALALDADLPARLLGDAARLRQIVGNLLSNAVKFTAEGGVRLTARCPRPDARPLPLEIVVEDSGIGIPADALPRLFTPFMQADSSTSRRYGGTGLGLSIVRQLCGLMGGRVEVDSTPGQGTRFVVHLAFEPAPGQALPTRPPLPAGAPDAVAVQRLPGVRVLVADDSTINLEVAQRILEREGAIITLARDGAAAVARLRAEPGGFDAVLLDVQMPVLDGLAAARCIRTELSLHELPLVALTAGALLSECQRALDAGMNDFVSKPFDPDGLVLVLRQQVERTQRRSLPDAPRPDGARPVAPWPSLAGIATEEARQRLQGDADFFALLLARLLDEFADLTTPPAATDAAAMAARLHKLGGSAALLAATDLCAAARRAEAQAGAGAGAGFGAELAEVGRLLAALAAEARPWLQRHEAARQAMAPEAAGPPDAQALARLHQALRARDLAALAQFEALAPALRTACGEAAFAQSRRALQQLDFDAVLALLSPAVDAPA